MFRISVVQSKYGFLKILGHPWLSGSTLHLTWIFSSVHMNGTISEVFNVRIRASVSVWKLWGFTKTFALVKAKSLVGILKHWVPVGRGTVTWVLT